MQALKEGREPDHSDYKQFKLTCENVGFQMLQKMGWKEGEGLGSEGQGIKNPVNKLDSSFTSYTTVSLSYFLDCCSN